MQAPQGLPDRKARRVNRGFRESKVSGVLSARKGHKARRVTKAYGETRGRKATLVSAWLARRGRRATQVPRGTRENGVQAGLRESKAKAPREIRVNRVNEALKGNKDLQGLRARRC